MKKILAVAAFAAIAVAGAMSVRAETDYPSATLLSRILTRIERIAAQLDTLESKVDDIVTAVTPS